MNRLIAWFAQNSIAPNLMMVLILAGGLLTIPRLKQEVFPEFSSDVVVVTVEYRGAAPEEVEEGVCLRVEEAIYGLAGIKRITSQAREGMGTVTVELLPGTSANQLLDEVKSRVDAIDTFPDETEKPIVEELTLRRQVIDVAVSGQTDERSLRIVSERVRDDLSSLPGISLVTLAGARPYEISIEVPEQTLQRHGLSLADVAQTVRRSSLDLPGGTVKTAGGHILIRTKGQAYSGREFEEITLLSRRDGTRIRLGEVATVVDGFEDTDQAAFFDGEPAIVAQVFRVGEQSALDIAETVKKYIAENSHRVPEGIKLTTWQDDAAVLASRLGLLIDNGLAGLALVCLLLALFLRFELALWVAIGIPISFLGAVWLLPALDISVNLISLFAFIVVLGIVVDDAIVVGENVHTHFESGKSALSAAIDGTKEVGVPVTFAVLTSVAAFAPLLTVPGNTGKVMKVIPAIVISTLIFSLIESLIILPTHLAHVKRQRRGFWLTSIWSTVNQFVARALELFVAKVYTPTLDFCLHQRYLTAAVGIVAFALTVGVVLGGRIQVVFFPPVDADNVVAFVTMPQGTSVDVTRAALAQMEKAAEQVREELCTGKFRSSAAQGDDLNGRDVFRHVFTSVGGQPYRETQNLRRGRSSNFSGSHLGEVNVELISSEARTVTSNEIARRWREVCGEIPEALELMFTSTLFSTGEALNVQLAASDVDLLRQAATQLKSDLAEYSGVTDITDSFRAGKRELKLSLLPAAEMLGVSLSDLALQVRHGFYGEEVQRIQRNRDDVRVMVRYPWGERRSLDDIESMRIRTATGTEVAFATVASVEIGRGYAAIQRADRRRIINVTADINQDETTSGAVIGTLAATTLPRLLEKYPGLSYSLEGEQREQRETFGGLARGFLLAVVAIYALLAIPFRSYLQPLIVMSAIPFGVVGVVGGHLLMGLHLTLLSFFGLVALTGVVVNDSLIMVDFINRLRARGGPLAVAVRNAGAARFRPILLTSLTTFAGLSPLLFEKSMQAQFLIPMAASLGFGVLFATFVTLVLVPAGYLILEDVVRLVSRARPPSEELPS